MKDTIALIEKSQLGDKKAREILIEENLGLVRHIVKRYTIRGYDAEDLFQIGTIGLMKAVDKFDSSFGVQFSTYAVPMIQGELRRFMRDDGMIKISRGLKENCIKVKRAVEKLSQELGREPQLSQIEEETGIDREDIVMALDAGMEVESIYKTIYQSDGNEIYMIDQLRSPGEEVPDGEKEKLINKILIEQLLDGLDEGDREIIRLRYFENVTQTEVAKRLGMSQVQVSRLEKKILLRMRKYLD
ncbi:SigB/SigF/SigG family RNA polymerase sigma factor [bacterium C-53]|nr:SigB/SigF/SigG family RNA polymerase sigma factor [Lachnospiraceae bacterium]NBI03715.1 SigB/SigF/SigG family RNA polymerase sigma factor [Lachnospiraceae bacterium]RKJ09271.1 SigB/SigF/SigG family RNA polymerase sigma factor [bacterium C-53]